MKIQIDNSQKTVEIKAEKIWNQTGIILKKGCVYTFTAQGIWKDSSIKCDANGHNAWYLRPFKFLRRYNKANWFALIGTIDKSIDTAFFIGKKLENYLAPLDGELVCFANDGQKFYWNNKGSLKLSLSKKSKVAG